MAETQFDPSKLETQLYSWMVGNQASNPADSAAAAKNTAKYYEKTGQWDPAFIQWANQTPVAKDTGLLPLLEAQMSAGNYNSPIPEKVADPYAERLQEFISTPQDYSYLTQDFGAGLDKAMKKYSESKQSPSDIYGQISSGADTQFQELLSKIQAPSTVDEAMKLAESEALNQELVKIDRDTKMDISDIEMTMGERGLLGEGRTSDIAEVARAQRLGMGGETKASARSAYLMKDLERQKAQEKAVIDAYSQRFAMEPQLQQVAQGWYDLQTDEQKMVLDTVKDRANLLFSQNAELAKLQSSDKQNLIDNLMKQLLQSQTLEFSREELDAKINQWEAENEQAKEELSVKARQGLDALESQPSFWEGLAGNAISGLAGGVGGAGTTWGLNKIGGAGTSAKPK